MSEAAEVLREAIEAHLDDRPLLQRTDARMWRVDVLTARCTEALAAAGLLVPAEHDREVAAGALREAADDIAGGARLRIFLGDPDVDTTEVEGRRRGVVAFWLRARAGHLARGDVALAVSAERVVRPGACPSCGSYSEFLVRPPCPLDQYDPDDWHNASTFREDEPVASRRSCSCSQPMEHGRHGHACPLFDEGPEGGDRS